MDTSGPSIGTEAPVSLFFGESETLTRRAADQVIATRLASEQQDYGLVRLRGAEATAERLGLAPAHLDAQLAPCREALREARARHVGRTAFSPAGGSDRGRG